MIDTILASASPRRALLLRTLIPEFKVVPSAVDETERSGESGADLALRLSIAKAREVFRANPDCLVIAGDTVVECAGQILGKPATVADAIAILEQLSGTTHRVITAVALLAPGYEKQFMESTSVSFRELSRTEIEAYVATGEPMDKAGAYAIQAGAAGFVSNLKGSFSNVVGLPLEALEEVLRRNFRSALAP